MISACAQGVRSKENGSKCPSESCHKAILALSGLEESQDFPRSLMLTGSHLGQPFQGTNSSESDLFG